MSINKTILFALICLISLCADPITIIGAAQKPDENQAFFENSLLNHLITLQNNTLFGTDYQIKRKIKVVVTAYSSTPEETDDTPFITATGNRVRDGIVATNMLPFGTKIVMPEVFRDKIFVVDDRMAAHKKYMVDVWFPSKEQAKHFGAKYTYIEVLE